VLSDTDVEPVARFLRAHPPFDAIDPKEVERVAASARLEAVSAGTTVFGPGDAPISHLRVIRSGAVEIVSDGRVLDLLGEGEMFGHAPMLSGLPAGFAARAAEDTELVAIPVEVAEPVLAQPAGLRYVARSLVEMPTDLHAVARQPQRNLADQPVGSLLSGRPVICTPETSIREAAARMVAAGESATIVELGGGELGIVTDRDLRTRVVAAGLSVDAPVTAVMSAPAYTCWPDRPAGEVLIEMVERGIRHFPVVAPAGAVLGVIDAVDLLAARTRSSFYLRERIAACRSVSELATVAAELRPMVIALHEARVTAANVMAAYSVSVDALTRRLLELELDRRAALRGVSFAWLALGSQARREALPSSDVDSAIVWFDRPDEDARLRKDLTALGRRVLDGLARCGLPADEHGASAGSALFVRSVGSWQRLVRHWIDHPAEDKNLLLTATMVDSRPVWGVHTGMPVADAFRPAPHSPALLRLIARFALSQRPPTGFLRGLVVEAGGAHRGRLDLKHGGVRPIVNLARWAGMTAGVTSGSTRERLRAAAAARTLPPADARTLEEAFALLCDMRAAHQVEQIRAGSAPDEYVDPQRLSPLMRAQLKDIFRAVAGIQRRLGSELELGVR
jgi:CBS domain-containing protein